MPEPEETPAAPRNGAAVDAAVTIAEWCEAQAARSTTLANRQITVVWWLLLGGLVLLLILPRVIQEIDFAGRKESLPPAVMATAEETHSSIAQNKDEMETEAENAAARLADQKQALTLVEARRNSARDAARSDSLTPHMLVRPTSRDIFLPGTTIAGMSVSNGTIFLTAVVPDADRPGRAAVFWSQDGARWTKEPVTQDIGIETLQSPAVTLTDDGTMILSSANLTINLWRRPPGDRWERILPPAGQAPQSGMITSLLTAGDGTIWAAGIHAAGRETRQLLLRSSDRGASWQPAMAQGNRLPVTSGGLGGLIEQRETIIATGWQNTAQATRQAMVLRGKDGGGWSSVPLLKNDAPVDGEALGIVARQDGTFFIRVTSANEGRMLFFSRDGETWHWVDTPSSLLRIWPGLDGAVLLSVENQIQGEAVRAFARPDQEGQPLPYPGIAPGHFDSELIGATYLPDGRKLLVTPEGPFTSLTTDEATAYFNARIASPEEGALPEPWAQILAARSLESSFANLSRYERELLTAQNDVQQQDAFVKTASASLERQDKALTQFAGLTTTLEQALRQAEPSRQLAQIATRLAVIGLLIYLVQIVVNRYRYLQRLAGFYQARAQALRLWAVQPEGRLMEGVSLADVTAMLSPEGIGFDKTAEPPTGQLASFLQAGLKRG